ncbi:immunoglobulin superfamily member 5 isoform X1 [Myotis myotis]|uniref:immunoglobulin superfamily member 5 isoform X1 n=1 Tax=Myotis myotis TaxID=51298 RepID=UPI00174CB562|nr:immunoglobulin superfamily member 5 isoform X1 [Myotis myotis]KAF6378426.1 immunoglobulin superfamily member 5 [Myotis myotis]
MEGSCQGVLAVLVVVAGLAAFGSSYQIIEGPKNATVLVGQEARFNCTVSRGWSLIMWALNGTVVLSVTPMGVIITSSHFTSENYTEGDDFTSEMIIHDVQLSDAGHIKCSLQNSGREGSAFLSVQVVGELLVRTDSLVVIEDEPCNVTCRAVGWNPLPELSWEIGVPVSDSSFHSVLEPDDPPSVLSILALTPRGSGNLTCVAKMKGLQARDSRTINLTVAPPHSGSIDKLGSSLPTWAIALLAVSFSLLFILIVVLIVIFCCCVSRREKTESSSLRKSADVETNQETFEPKLKGGNENYGYSAESASPPAKSSGSSLPTQQSSRQPQQVTQQLMQQVTQQVMQQATKQEPELHQQAPTSRPHVSFYTVGPRMTRNVTLV